MDEKYYNDLISMKTILSHQFQRISKGCLTIHRLPTLMVAHILTPKYAFSF